jgi:hypothetical protein
VRFGAPRSITVRSKLPDLYSIRTARSVYYQRLDLEKFRGFPTIKRG